MHQTKLVGVFVLFLTAVGVRCSWQPFDDYETDDYSDGPAWHCDTETKNALAEVKSEIQALQELLVGLRQKLDPDFRSPTSTTPQVELKCPPGFQYVKAASSCYKVIYEEVDWTSADRKCRGLHPEAHLIAITTNDENSALKAYLKQELAKNSPRSMRRFRSWGGSADAKLWTSGQRLNETSCADQFVWKISNNTQLPLSFTYWNDDEPNCWRNMLEGCLELIQDAHFKWNDVPCDIVLYPLCEYDPL